MKIFRVFVTRHYIDVLFFDIEAETPAKARNLAKKSAYKITPDSRSIAQDNGWIPEQNPVEISCLGHYGEDSISEIIEVFKNKTGTSFIHDSMLDMLNKRKEK